jgi:hypothetical protein
MKRKPIFTTLALALISIVACDEPETVVTNFVHTDGSVTRRIEMVSHQKNFKNWKSKVPFDNTWAVHDSISINQKGDSTWYKTAVKLFRNADEINLSYKADTGINKDISRQAGFTKTFKWFNTEYRFSEKIDQRLKSGYPVGDFLNKEELLSFYSPESLKAEKERGPDSLMYKALADSVKAKTDLWSTTCVVSEWISAFSKLTEGKTDSDMTARALKSREKEFVRIVNENNSRFDSLWTDGAILRQFVGEANAARYKSEADTAMDRTLKSYFFDFNDYSVRIVMPGKLIGTNGFIDSSRMLLWPVKSDYFLTVPYEMWAESKTTNSWAWILSGLFVVFVLAGTIIRIIKKD